jgi:PadR family transcriptional regulator PadR
MISTQFKKGVLKMAVLALLTKRKYYGYELVTEISKNIEISEGTIYPLLRRLKNDELVVTYLQESKEGAPRKYYKLTDKGKNVIENLIKEWSDFSSNVNKILDNTSE